MSLRRSLFVALMVLSIISCQKQGRETEYFTNTIENPAQPELPETHFNYSDIELPEFFQTNYLDLLDNTNGNPVTDEGATLGRVLFYDVNLSANKTISCSSCHFQSLAFADPRPSSQGFEGGFTGRNSMPLFNHRYSRRMFWDRRAANLEAQVLMPIQDQVEMGMNLDDLVARLSDVEYYPTLFEDAFGDSEINSDKISKALAQFVRSILSFNSKYDLGIQSDFSNFSNQELQGKEVFFNSTGNCNQCHISSNFFQTSALNNGLEVEYTDPGFYDVSGNIEDHGKFKVPSLRNIELSAPYMHDGRFATLEEVVEFYNSGMQAHPYLDERLSVDGEIGGPPKQLNLSEEDKDALVAFLKTLTDYEFIVDEKFSNPFPSE